MDERFFATIIHCFFIAFGVIIGGAFIGSMGSFFTGASSLNALTRIAQSLKIWAIIAAIGGTFDAILSFQRGFLEGSTLDIFKQLIIILAAMLGVKFALILIAWLVAWEL